MRIIGNDPSVPRQEHAVASGTLPSGKSVVVNTDGTVSVVSGSSASQALGSVTDFDTDTNTYLEASVVHDPDQNKIIIAYRDNGNANRGTAIVGTVSGTSISFGTAVVFHDSGASGQTDFNSIVYDSSNNKVVISFRGYDGSSSTCKSIVGTVSGTSISFGTAVTFSSDSANYMHSTFDSNSNKVVVVFRDQGNSSYGTAIVGTVSGTSISFGSEVVFESATVSYPQCVFDSSNNKVVVAYKDEGNSDYGTAIVGTVSGTSISFGTAVVYHSARADLNKLAFDSTNNKVVIAFRDNGDNEKGKALVGTVSGTSISFGSTVTFSTSGTRIDYSSLSYNVAAQKVIVTYRQYIDSSAVLSSELNEGTVSGTSISFGSSIKFADRSDDTASVYDSTNKLVVIAFQDFTDSKKGASLVFQSAYTSTNLTSENYIGMSSGAAFQTGSAATLGSPTVFESAETAYFGAAFDSNSNRVVFSYQDSGNSNYGTAVVGTISGTSISFGTPVVFESATTTRIAVAFDSNLNKIVIAYQDGGNSSHGTAIVGTVASGDNSITFGSAAVFSSASTEEINIVFDTNANKFVISYKASSEGKAIVATVSGTSISFGSEATFAAYSLSGISSAFDSNSNKVLLSYKFPTYNNEAGKARVGTVSGTSISFGTEATFVTADLGITLAIFDASQNKFVVIWGVGSSSYAVVATISGTDVSFGSTLTLSDDADQYYSGHYDSAAQKCIFVYHDNNDDGAYTSFTISGTTATQGEVVIFESTTMAYAATTFDSSAEKSVVAYKANYGATGYGTAVVFNADSTATTRGEVADGGHALIDTQGAISDNQIGLTPAQSYFVQTDGTLGTTAASPSVFAGTAVSATKLIVKG